eukprot:scaffold60075_cov31-Tisochrysis_lutea.AAC.6
MCDGTPYSHPPLLAYMCAACAARASARVDTARVMVRVDVKRETGAHSGCSKMLACRSCGRGCDEENTSTTLASSLSLRTRS